MIVQKERVFMFIFCWILGTRGLFQVPGGDKLGECVLRCTQYSSTDVLKQVKYKLEQRQMFYFQITKKLQIFLIRL